MYYFQTFTLLTLTSLMSRSLSYRVLLIPIQMKSHVSDMSAIAVQLAVRGHDVHVLLADSFPVPEELRESNSDKDNDKAYLGHIRVDIYDRPDLGGPLDFDEIYDNMTRMILEERASASELGRFMEPLLALESRRLLMYNEALYYRLGQLRFDLAVVDSIPMIKYFYLVTHRLGVPWVTFTDLVDPTLIRVPWLPSFVPFFPTSFTEKMTFFERLQNTLLMIVFASYKVFPDPAGDILSKYREYGSFECLDDLAVRSLIWITTKDVVLDYPKPAMPNIIDVGGLTVKPPTGYMPDEVRQFVDGAGKGVIIVSFGTAAFKLPANIANKFVSCFKRLAGYRIVWRLGMEKGTVLPSNIMALNWLPQNELLAHPKTILFITHCGNNGQFESLFHGVPMIGFPLHGDQPYNAKRMEYKGFGIAMDIHEFTSDELLENVHRVISNKAYSERIGHASAIWKDSHQQPAEKVVWWLEHVIKYGADHLISAGNLLTGWQYCLLDVLAFLVLAVTLALTCLWKTCGLLWKIFDGSKSTNLKQKHH